MRDPVARIPIPVYRRVSRGRWLQWADQVLCRAIKWPQGFHLHLNHGHFCTLGWSEWCIWCSHLRLKGKGKVLLTRIFKVPRVLAQDTCSQDKGYLNFSFTCADNKPICPYFCPLGPVKPVTQTFRSYFSIYIHPRLSKLYKSKSGHLGHLLGIFYKTGVRCFWINNLSNEKEPHTVLQQGCPLCSFHGISASHVQMWCAKQALVCGKTWTYISVQPASPLKVKARKKNQSLKR